ncbi:MAG: hypothetical protein QM831_15160 [Kofleriaceae bacterium]
MSRELQARRILDRYLVEIVEHYELCPWAKMSRTGGELYVEFLWGTPSEIDWQAAAARAFVDPKIRVAMLVAPELQIDRVSFHDTRDRLAKAASTLGVAEFHPDAPYDAKTPARLVPFLRRSPDPLLQCVPLALLDQVRGPPLTVERSEQIALLVKQHGIQAVKPPLADRIAQQNHARVTREDFEQRIAAIMADRATAY